VLGFEESDHPSLDLIKKNYRIRILKYHPDKNPSPEAADQFRETKAAYDFLNASGFDNGSTTVPSYESVLKSFLSSVFSSDTTGSPGFSNNLGLLVMMRLLRFCGTALIAYLRKIDRTLLQKIYDILHLYQDAFHLPPSFLSSIKDILAEHDEECIVLHPSLEDLLLENIYKLKHGNETFLVPLWHQDMVYDSLGKDLHVNCFPILPDHMELDEWNNLYVHVDYTVGEIWGCPMVEVEVGSRIYNFDPSLLRLTCAPQEIKCDDRGISAINVDDPFDVSKKQHVFLIVHLQSK
jgi:hypothetical protein